MHIIVRHKRKEAGTGLAYSYLAGWVISLVAIMSVGTMAAAHHKVDHEQGPPTAPPGQVQESPPGEAEGHDKILICHATGSETNPYVLIEVPSKQIEMGVGHATHPEDIIPAPATGCPTGAGPVESTQPPTQVPSPVDSPDDGEEPTSSPTVGETPDTVSPIPSNTNASPTGTVSPTPIQEVTPSVQPTESRSPGTTASPTPYRPREGENRTSEVGGSGTRDNQQTHRDTRKQSKNPALPFTGPEQLIPWALFGLGLIGNGILLTKEGKY